VIFIVTGEVGAGKTTFVRRTAEALRERGGKVAGFASERVFENGSLAGYDLVDLANGKRAPWLRRGIGPDRIGPYAVEAGGLAFARKVIGGSAPSEFLIIDELGPLELASAGFWPALRPVLDDPAREFLFVIRTSCLEDFRRIFSGRILEIFAPDRGRRPEDAAGEIVRHADQG
jgi:nucleoside-triphosphatase THEP1